MRIVIAAGLYPPDIGGPATYAEMIVRELPAHGFTIEVLPYSTVRHLPKWRRHTAYFVRLWKMTKTADILYALDPMSVGVPARIVALLLRKPFYIRLGGDYVWEQGVQRFGITETLDVYTQKTTRRPCFVRILAFIQTWVVRGAQRVVVPSKYLASIITTWGIAKERIMVIYSAHTVTPANFDKVAIQKEYGFFGAVLMSVARLTPWKGMETLIQLVVLRRNRGEDVSLVIVGDGPERARLEAIASQYGVSDFVHLIGAKPQKEVFTMLAVADVFLLNTAYEGLSHQLLEVMNIGVPIITTSVGGNPELIQDGIEGLLVPVNDVSAFDRAVSYTLEKEEETKARIAKAHERALQFSSHDAVQQVAHLLRGNET